MRPQTTWLALTFGALAAILASSAHAQTQAVYVSEGGGEHVTRFALDSATGQLTEKQKIRVGRSPGAQCVDPVRRLLHVSLTGENRIATLKIAADGTLELMQIVDAPHRPTYLALDRTRSVLLSAYYGANLVAVHKLDGEGLPSKEASQVLETEEKAHAVEMDPSNRFAYVPCCGADSVMYFRLDPMSRTLAAVENNRAPAGEGSAPRHLWFHPEMAVLYVVNEKSDSVSMYEHDRLGGGLAPKQTLSTLPQDFDGTKNTCADIELTPDSKLLIASNRGHNSLAVYGIDQATGWLISLGQVPTEETPRSFNIDATGKWLVCAGQASNKLAVYAITDADKRLEHRHTLSVGRGPNWVQFVTLPNP
jgi:6-phosphogluconolactonase